MAQISEAVAKAIRSQIGNLEDNAYRYRHLGGRPADILIAEKQEREAETLKAELKELSR